MLKILTLTERLFRTISKLGSPLLDGYILSRLNIGSVNIIALFTRFILGKRMMERL